jgi:hypothetical protein
VPPTQGRPKAQVGEQQTSTCTNQQRASGEEEQKIQNHIRTTLLSSSLRRKLATGAISEIFTLPERRRLATGYHILRRRGPADSIQLLLPCLCHLIIPSLSSCSCQGQQTRRPLKTSCTRATPRRSSFGVDRGVHDSEHPQWEQR